MYLCVVRRWYKELGVAIASEGKMRAEAKEYISGDNSGDNLGAELTPFTFSKDIEMYR